MDHRDFDALARSVADSSRRRLLGALLGGALAAVGLGEAAAKPARCKSDADCSGCQRCDKKKKRCVKACPKGKQCCGGACVKPELCCKKDGDCNRCAVCEGGRCRPDASKNGQKCGGQCLVCANGACGLPEDDLCPSGQRCRNGAGTCCPRCRGEQCCKPGAACVNPGIFSANFCCDESANTPCGSNGDGTFKECCSNKTERCRGGRCVPKDEDCGDDRRAAGGVCCASPDQVCTRFGERYCCPKGQVCCPMRHGADGVCCARDRCLGVGLCCAPGAEVFCSGEHAHCAFGPRVCCGAYSCPADEGCDCSGIG